jgi:hypothetical protein
MLDDQRFRLMIDQLQNAGYRAGAASHSTVPDVPFRPRSIAVTDPVLWGQATPWGSEDIWGHVRHYPNHRSSFRKRVGQLRRSGSAEPSKVVKLACGPKRSAWVSGAARRGHGERLGDLLKLSRR